MNRQHLTYLALACSMIYGVSFAVVGEAPQWYRVGGALVVGLAWMAVGMLGRPAAALRRRS